MPAFGSQLQASGRAIVDHFQFRDHRRHRRSSQRLIGSPQRIGLRFGANKDNLTQVNPVAVQGRWIDGPMHIDHH